MVKKPRIEKEPQETNEMEGQLTNVTSNIEEPQKTTSRKMKERRRTTMPKMVIKCGKGHKLTI